MKNRKMSLPFMLLVLTLIAYVIASFVFCYTTKPEVTEGEFPFSITYEYKGETKTLSGIFECEFSHSRTVRNEHNRYWNGFSVIENSGDNVLDKNEDMLLSLHENMSAGYFMGDPQYKDFYQSYGLDGIEPYVEYYDNKNNISLNDENRDAVLESIGFKVVDYTYAEPIENSFSTSGILYSGDNVIIFVAILLVFMILCLIFVRKDKQYEYSKLDKAGIIINFITAIFVLPFITVGCWLFDLNGSGMDLVSQIAYNVPSASILCLALSIVFRRKGFRKAGFFVQFGGIVLFVLLFVLDALS